MFPTQYKTVFSTINWTALDVVKTFILLIFLRTNYSVYCALQDVKRAERLNLAQLAFRDT